MADETQIAQLVLNLVVNAAEAMGGTPGEVLLATSEIDATPSDFERTYTAPDLPAGAYRELVVTDMGEGIASDTAARIFEPFFSTRLTGRGLGLPAALGIVRGHRGAIGVESLPGRAPACGYCSRHVPTSGLSRARRECSVLRLMTTPIRVLVFGETPGADRVAEAVRRAG